MPINLLQEIPMRLFETTYECKDSLQMWDNVTFTFKRMAEDEGEKKKSGSKEGYILFFP